MRVYVFVTIVWHLLHWTLLDHPYSYFRLTLVPVSATEFCRRDPRRSNFVVVGGGALCFNGGRRRCADHFSAATLDFQAAYFLLFVLMAF